MFVDGIVLVVACVVIWLASGVIIEAVEKINRNFRLSRLALSLFVLGAVTSLPEVGITVNSLLFNSPQIAYGTLIGSQIFLLFVAIPVLAIISRGINLQFEKKQRLLSLTFLLALIPLAGLYNQQLEVGEAFITLVVYLFFVFLYLRRGTFLEQISEKINRYHSVLGFSEIMKCLVMLGVLFLATNTAVRAVVEISAVLQISRFMFSLIVLPIASNLPELSLAIHAVVNGKKSIVLQDYFGSITFNSFLLAILSLGTGGTIIIGQNVMSLIVIFFIGVCVMSWFCFTQKKLSGLEALLLLIFYVGLTALPVFQILIQR